MYNLYVARNRFKSKEYRGFVLEGAGLHVEKVESVDVLEKPRVATISAYIWAVEMLANMQSYRELQGGEITYYIPSVMLQNWLLYFIDGMGKKPPTEYFDLVYDLFRLMERTGFSYRLAVTQFNRATSITTPTYYAKTHTEPKLESIEDAFSDLLNTD